MMRNRPHTPAENQNWYVYQSTEGRFYRAMGVLLILLMNMIAAANVITWRTRGADAIHWEGPGQFLLGYIFACFLSLCLINMYPTIWLSEDGITISHNLFWRIFVPWKHVVALRVLNAGVGAVVLTKRLTRFHYGYGLVALTFAPAFWIAYDVSNRERLYSQIKRHMTRSVAS